MKICDESHWDIEPEHNGKTLLCFFVTISHTEVKEIKMKYYN